MAGGASFDIVSKVDRQEVDNAIGQTARELATRFDFKDTGAQIAWAGGTTPSRSRRRPRTG